MSAIRSIDHVQLGFPAGQQPVIRRFYGELVGLPEVAAPGTTLRFHAGAQRVDLVPADAWSAPAAPAHLALAVQDLPALRARLLAGGFTLDESRPLPGHRRFYVSDPAGNALEFLEPEGGGA